MTELEHEFWNLQMKDLEIEQYITRFNELSGLVPHLVTPETKRIDRFIYGLTPDIRRDVMTSRPVTMQDAAVLAKQLARDVARSKPTPKTTTTDSGKRKLEGTSGSKNTQNQNKQSKTVKAYVAAVSEFQTLGYVGSSPKCPKCNLHHTGVCPVCEKCRKPGHVAKYCKMVLANPPKGCFECGAPDHVRNQCPRFNQNQQNRNPPGNRNFQQQQYQQPPRPQQQQQQPQQNPAGQARARVFVLDAEAAQQNPRVVTGTFLLEDQYAFMLFDSGAERSFVSLEFRPLLKSTTSQLDELYSVEYANGQTFETRDVVLDCSLNLNGRTFSIDLIPVDLSSFDIIIGMDWLSRNHANIACYEKVVRMPLPSGETFTIHGDRTNKELKVVSAMRFSKYLNNKDCHVFLANIVDKSIKPKDLKEVPTVREFPDVFPDDLPGLPPARQVEFRIDLVPGAAPVAKSPYRLAPSEMQELSGQLQELLSKGFIRPSSSPWGAPILFVKKKDGSMRM